MRQLPDDKLGWMEPVFFGHTEEGRPLGAFSPDDFQRIKDGYACPRCWQKFSIVMVKCPVCELDLTQNLDPQVVDYPDEWVPGEDREKKPV